MKQNLLIRQQLGLRLLLLLALAAPAAMADLADAATYSITFSGSGVMPASGGFTYDPDTTTFTSFVVTWDGVTFDLTSSANAPSTDGLSLPSCIGGLTGASASFALLSGACASNPDTFWFGDTEVNQQARFDFHSGDVGSFPDPLDVTELLLSGPVSTDRGGGSWVIARVGSSDPVPEPAAVILTLTMLGLVTLVKRKQLAR